LNAEAKPKAFDLFYTPLYELNPPSIGITAPVIKLAASEQRKITAPFSSSILPNLFMGVLPITSKLRCV
jgi:hypothetical protein